MADEKQMNAIRFFCAKPYSGPNSKRSKESAYCDWSYLVQQISYFDFGHIQKDDAIVLAVVRAVRKEFPYGPWHRLGSGYQSYRGTREDSLDRS